MSRKPFYPLIRNILTIIVFCLLFSLPIWAQETNRESDIIWEKFKAARKAPCGERGEAIKLGKELIEKYRDNENNKVVIDWVKNEIPIIEEEDRKCKSDSFTASLYKNYNKEKNATCGYRDEAIRIGGVIANQFGADSVASKSIKIQVAAIEREEKKCKYAIAKDPLAALFERYKIARKAPCGQRAEAIRIGKEIIEKFGNDIDNGDVMEFIKKDVARMEAEEKNCPTYNSQVLTMSLSGLISISE